MIQTTPYPLAMMAVLGLCLPATSATETNVAAAKAEVRIEADEATAALAILAARQKGEPVPEATWKELEGTEGFRRMLEREQGINELFGVDRGIDAASFRRWATSDAALEHLEAQRVGLGEWRRVDVQRAASRALAYLPPGTELTATIYPLVREQRNSFVWDLGTDDAAIFMYVEPGRTAAELEHILAHELHHVGTATCESEPPDGTDELQLAHRWLSGFGEGHAVLAAAGGPDAATHPFGNDETHRQWQQRIDHLADDMRALEAFYTEILDGELSGDDVGRRGMQFLNTEDAPQGAFYSVGWHMAATVERELGRDAVVATVCQPVQLLIRYNEAVASAAGGGDLPVWSEELLERLQGPG